MNFITAVGRVMAANGIIRGDTDLPTTFSDLQHGATIRLAQYAIQDELNELTSDSLIPYEKSTSGTITTTSGTRAYALAADFVRFFGRALLYNSVDNWELFEYPGGVEKLRRDVYNYATQTGDPYCWYIEEGTTKQIGFFPVPQSAKTYTYDYEKDVSVTNSTDTLPFQNEIEAQAFCRLASRRFKFLYEEQDISTLYQDPEHMAAKATLFNLIKGKNPPVSYAPIYR